MFRADPTTTLVATGLVAFTVGLGAAFLFSRPAPPDEPIIRSSYEIEQSAPAQSVALSNAATLPREAKCNPFDVSEVAMEEVLDQMIRRGWRSPPQGEAVALTNFTLDPRMQAVDPNALVQNARLSGSVPAEVAVAAEPVLAVGDAALTPPSGIPAATPAPDQQPAMPSTSN